MTKKDKISGMPDLQQDDALFEILGNNRKRRKTNEVINEKIK